MRIGETQQRILNVLTNADRPMTINQIAQEMMVAPQTVRNHIPKLQNMGKIELDQRRIEGASAYRITDSANAVRFPISWMDGNHVSLRDIFIGIGKGDVSKNPMWFNLQMVIAKLYRLSLMNLDDDNPQPLSVMELRELRVMVETIRREARNIVEACADMVALDDLWNPRELPKQLIINDTVLDIEKARDIAYRID